EKIAHHHPRQFGSLNHAGRTASSKSMGPDPRLVVTSREAGFDLVAPTLGRFCTKYSIAPLNASAVKLLCSHWHGLMSAVPSEAKLEADEISNQILKSPSLTKLAENPLLLTMLLVVKHGAGKLPPDRVSLYQRAVEILLDTWNIKGHAALNPKEAVPQLSCIAFEMLRQGKQTATEDEIVEMISRSRDRITSIGRYAKDSPEEFLKRVELRSSLLVEGGHQSENGKLVPFYQFRHLTFQEYLAAEAIVHGNTVSAEDNDNLVEELGEELAREKWKEVVPMVAVLLGRRTKPLLQILLNSALQPSKESSNANTDPEEDSLNEDRAAAPRLIHCMIEEAEFPREIIDESCAVVLQYLLDVFVKDNVVTSLSQSVYGRDLREASWRMFSSSEVISRDTVLLCSMFEAACRGKPYWTVPGNESAVCGELTDENEQSRVRATLAVAGAFWLHRSKTVVSKSTRVLAALEANISSDSRKLSALSAWAWGFWRHISLGEKRRKLPPTPTDQTVSILAKKFVDLEKDWQWLDFTAAISTLKEIGRNSTNISLTEAQWKIVEKSFSDKDHRESRTLSALRLCYIARNKFSDDVILEWVKNLAPTSIGKRDVEDIYDYYKVDIDAPRQRQRQRRRSASA
ncbi:NACHT domain-containing protein, partial [Paracoccus tibetensis]